LDPLAGRVFEVPLNDDYFKRKSNLKLLFSMHFFAYFGFCQHNYEMKMQMLNSKKLVEAPDYLVFTQYLNAQGAPWIRDRRADTMTAI
jgi:hypothetical protein